LATDVQQLLLKIDANTELARRELNKMDGDFSRFERRSEEAAGTADKAFAGIGKAATFAKATIVGFAAGIGVEGIVAFGRAVLQAADELDAAAEKAGIGVERFQTLKESLRSLEVDGEKVDAIFGRLTDTLGAVQGGTAAEGVVSALDRMGITSRILNGEIDTTDELLDAIAESAGKFSSQAEFTAGVIDIVGRKLGVDLANALKDGGKALKQGEADFKAAGGVVEEEYIAKLADANEAIDRFVSNSKSKLIIFAGDTLTAFEEAGDAIDEYVAKALGAFDAAAGVTAPKQPGAGTQNAKDRAAATLAQLTPGTGIYNQLAADYQRQFGEAPPVRDSAELVVTASRIKKATATSGPRSQAPAKRELSPAEQRLFANDIEGPAPFDAPALVNLDQLGGQLQEIKATVGDIFNADIINPQAIEAANRFGENLSRNLAQAIVFGQNLGDALVNAFAAAAAEAISSGLFSILSGALGLGGGGGLLGSLFGGFRASGGPVSAGKAYVVGERGPEIIVPGSSGTVIPNNRIGGGGVSQFFDLRGAVVTERLYADMQRIGAQAAQAGALGGAQMAAANQARRAQRRLG
jgi:hypothetical protein